jgi:adenylate cyclase
MMAKKSLAQRLGWLLERVTRQSGRLSTTPAYGSWLLGKVSESQRRRRVRIQVILTIFMVAANLVGIGVALLLVTVAFPVPSVFSDAPPWLTFAIAPAYVVIALALGTYWITRRTVTVLRWAIEERTPTSADERNTFLVPGGWRWSC